MKNPGAIAATTDMASADTKAILLMVLGALCFASMGAVIHALGSRIDWHILVLLRTTLTFLFVAALLVRSADGFPFPIPPTLWLRSIAGSAAMFSTFYAFTHLPVSDATVLLETRPIWVALLAAPVLGERTGWIVWLCMSAGILGVALIEEPYFNQRDYTVLIALGGALAGGVAMVCLRRLAYMNPKAIIAHFSAFATLAMVAMIVISDVSIDTRELAPAMTNPDTLLLLAAMALLATAGQLAMTKAFSLSPAPRLATVGPAKVGLAACYDIVFWDRVFALPTLGGMALILGSLGLLFNRKS